MKFFIDSTLGDITLAAGNKTLTDVECECRYLVVETGHASNAIIAPNTYGMNFIVANKDETNNAIIKVAGRTGVTVPPGTAYRIWCNGTDYAIYTVRVFVIPSSSPSSSNSPSNSPSLSPSSSKSPSESISESPSLSPSSSVSPSSSISSSVSPSPSG
jgi:hypothetical protein